MDRHAGGITMKVSAYVTPDGHPPPDFGGLPLAFFRKRFSGDEGEITDPFSGAKHHVSLKEWANTNPDTTVIVISFVHTYDR